MMGLWLCVSATSALIITPAMVYVFRPEFILGKGEVSDGAELNEFESRKELSLEK